MFVIVYFSNGTKIPIPIPAPKNSYCGLINKLRSYLGVSWANINVFDINTSDDTKPPASLDYITNSGDNISLMCRKIAWRNGSLHINHR